MRGSRSLRDRANAPISRVKQKGSVYSSLPNFLMVSFLGVR